MLCNEVIEHIQFVNIRINGLRIAITIASHILYIKEYGSELIWWSVFQKLVVCTKVDIYCFIINTESIFHFYTPQKQTTLVNLKVVREQDVRGHEICSKIKEHLVLFINGYRYFAVFSFDLAI